MIKEAIEKIEAMAKVEQFEFDDIDFTSKQLFPVKNEAVETLGITTLAGFVEFASFQKADEVMVQVKDYNAVELISKEIDKFNGRQCFARASSIRNQFAFGTPHNVETFIVQLQSQFESTDDRRHGC